METNEVLSVGKLVGNFKVPVYFPDKMAFGEFELQEYLKKHRWIILFFYPGDFTFVCPTELKDLSDKYDELGKVNAFVLSLSTDTTYVHLAWQQQEKLLADIKFPMGSDATGEISRMLGVYDEKAGMALRGSFIINQKGILVSSEINYYNVGRNADELLRKVRANEYLINHPAEACPAKWEPGSKTLKPSEKIVGKIFEALE